MNNIYLLRKLIHPVLPSNILHREALLSELVQAVHNSFDKQNLEVRSRSCETILFYAPAGYGKTTLLTDLAEHVTYPFCWYFLDVTDEDTILFFKLLLKNIRRYFPLFGEALETQLDNLSKIENHEHLLQYLEMFLDAFLQSIEEDIPSYFVLVLCDYHKISAEKITNIVINRFIQRIPAQCMLLIESRAMPNLDFTSLLVYRQILIIDALKLRFSSQDIRMLASMRKIHVTLEESEYLEQTFEGWIAGILLGTHLGNTLIPLINHSLPNKVNSSHTHIEHKYLFNYFVKQVFAHQPEAYKFLQETVVLHRMIPEFCDALLMTSNTASLLSYLVEQGLFVTHYLNGSEHIFLCHPILRELLYEDLQATDPQRLLELHRRAIELFRETDIPEAIAQALTAKEYVTAAQLIETVSVQHYSQGLLTTLAYWIDSIPSEITNRYPHLLLTRANIFLEESIVTNVPPLLEQALAILNDTQMTASFQAEVFLAQAKLLLQQGHYLQAQNLCKQALTLLAEDEIDLRALTHQLLGSCAAYLNDFTSSFVELQQALQLYQYNTRNNTRTYQVAKIHTLLANSYMTAGRNALSEYHRTRAIQLWESIHNEWGKIDNIIGLGAFKEQMGESEESERFLVQALNISRGSLHYECGEAYALANLGNVYQNQDKFQQALAAFEESLSLSRRLNENFLTSYLICQIARTYQLLGDSYSAMLILSQLQQESYSSDNKAPLSFEQALYALTHGTILLQTGKLKEAFHDLEAATKALTESKYEYITAMIQIAVCLLAQGKRQVALQYTQKAVQIAEKYEYTELARREFRRNPDLFDYVKNAIPSMIQALNIQENNSNVLPASDLSSPTEPVSHPPSNDLMPTLTIQALGSPMVYKDSELISTWRTNRSMELFFLLLNTPHPLAKEQILEALWHEGKEPSNQAWRSTLYYLRQVLGVDCVKAYNGVYEIQLENLYKVDYDVDSFYGFYNRAQKIQQKGEIEEARLLFEKVSQLYKGDFVSLFQSDWCIPRRTELRHMYTDVQHQLALIAWQQRQIDTSIYYWQCMIELDTTLEVAYEGLIRCYIEQGKLHLALQEYNHCKTLLKNEMHVEPSHTLQSLYQHITELYPMP